MCRDDVYRTIANLELPSSSNLLPTASLYGSVQSPWSTLTLTRIAFSITGNAVSSERVQSGKFWYWTRETLSVWKGFNLGNFGTGHRKRCQFGKGSIWEILVLDTGNAVSSERVQSGKFWYWTRETLSVRKGFNLGNFGTGHGKRCQFGKGSIWEIFVLHLHRARSRVIDKKHAGHSASCGAKCNCSWLGLCLLQHEFWYVRILQPGPFRSGTTGNA